MDIRAELRDLMEKNSYSTAYISTATGLAKSTISMWLNGTYNGKNDKVTDALINGYAQDSVTEGQEVRVLRGI